MSNIYYNSSRTPLQLLWSEILGKIVSELSSCYFLPSSNDISENCIREAFSIMVCSPAWWSSGGFARERVDRASVWIPGVQSNLPAATFPENLLNFLQIQIQLPVQALITSYMSIFFPLILFFFWYLGNGFRQHIHVSYEQCAKFYFWKKP